jgi:uncharacterized membrane protein
MYPVAWIGLWAILFVGTHLIISSSAIRPGLIARVGEQPYRGIYSFIGFATLIPLIVVFAGHKHSGPMLWYARADGPMRWLTWALMLLAFIMLVSGLVTPSPASIGAPARGAPTPRGLLKVSRHPSFVAFALFGFAHMLMNGWLGDLIFFGTFPLLGIVGGKAQDARKLREIGDGYRKFMDETSFFPGLALMSGRLKWASADMPWAGILVGIALAIVTIVVHPWLFGGQPLG